MKRATLMLTALTLLFGAGRGKADFIYDNLPYETYKPVAGYTVSGSSSSVGFNEGHTESFIAGASANLSDVQIAMWSDGFPSTSGFTLTLTDASNDTLESWHALAPTGNANVTIPVVQVDSVLHPLLQAGQRYYLTASADSTTADAWEANSDTYTQTIAGFRVDGESSVVTPEPSTLTLLGIGAVSMLGWRWRHRKKARLCLA